jgi:2-hydroxychromene-2-carboxylate isomerase
MVQRRQCASQAPFSKPVGRRSAISFAELLQETGLSAQRIEQAHTQTVQERYDADTQRAMDIGVFGAPSYVIDGEMFWGQDRLDFVQRKLEALK